MISESIESIEFFYEDLDFQLSNEGLYLKWIKEILKVNKAELKALNFIFCDDSYILNVNLEYLNHDYYTDIISFPYSEFPHPIEGDIFISIDRVLDNSKSNNVSFENELQRVMAHGVLHFLGYKDKSEKDITEMRIKENEMIDIFNTIVNQ